MMAAPAASAAPAAAGAGDKKLAPAAGKDDKKTLAPSAEAKKAQAKKSSSLVDSLQLPPLLDVWAMEAKDLTGSKPDAYVKVFLIDENGEKLSEKGKPLEFRSEVIKGTKAPVWYVKGEDQTSKDGRVKVAPEPDPTFASREYPKLCLDAKAVRLEVFGAAFFGDDFLGQVNIPFSEIPEVVGDVKEAMAAGKVHTQWYELKPATVKPKPVTGQIRVRLAYKSGELKKKEAEEKLKAVGNTYKKERQQTAAADIDEKRKRDEEEKAFAAALGKETPAAKRILGATMATGSRWKGVITLDANSVTKQPASRHFLDFVVTRHLSVAAAKAADPTRPVNEKAAPRLAGEYITLASLQTGEKAETVELVLREKADIAVPAHKDKEGKDIAAGVRAGVVATVTPHADLFMREAVKKFKEMADAERQKREQALEEAKKRGEDTTLGVEPGSPAAGGSGKGAKSLEEMFANSVRLFGAFNESMDELTGAVHEVTPDQVLTASEDLGHVKGSFVLMVGPRYEAALKAQQQAREALRKKDAEEEQKRFAAETAAFLDTVDARIKPAVLALSTGSVWHGFVTAGKDKEKREGKYELKVSYRHKHLAHATHVAVRPTAFGHNQAIGIEVVRGDVEITDPKAAADAKAAGTGYTLPGATGSAAQKVYRCEIRVIYEDKDNKYRGVFDPATGQIAGFVYESRDAATVNPIASFTLAKGGVPASAPAAAAPAPAPAAAAPATAAPAAAKN